MNKSELSNITAVFFSCVGREHLLLNAQAETIRLSNEGAPGGFFSRVLMGLEGSEEAA
jgi:hypothetical protein